MKKLLLLFLLTISFIAKGQKIFSVKYESRADVKVFVVAYESRADLLVYKVKYQSMVNKNEGKWFFVDYESLADKKIFFVDYESRADLKIFFVDYETRAGWREISKKHLLYKWQKKTFPNWDFLNKSYFMKWITLCIQTWTGKLVKHLVQFIIQEKNIPKLFQKPT